MMNEQSSHINSWEAEEQPVQRRAQEPPKEALSSIPTLWSAGDILNAQDWDEYLQRCRQGSPNTGLRISSYSDSWEADEEEARRLEYEHRNRQRETHHDPSIDALSESQPYYPSADTTASITRLPRFPEVHTGLYPHVYSSLQAGYFRPTTAPPQSNASDGEPWGSIRMRTPSSTAELTRLNSEPEPMIQTRTSVWTGGGAVMFDHFDCSDESKGKVIKEWYRTFKELVGPMFPGTHQQLPVRIAVLDTGIDFSKLSLPDWIRIRDAKSFVPNEDHIDLVGHGTQVTSVLLDMAYNAHIYVARVLQGNNLDDPTYIAEAIRYATDTWKVDIINMSIGFYSDERVISDAIKHAYTANVLMFAAARNDGGNFSVAFPARHKDVICISATDGYGTPSSFNPPVFDLSDNFAAIGEALPLPSFKGYPVSTSGTSYATPVAVSIASLVLAYVRENFPNGEKDEAERRLKESPDGMRAALNLMSSRIKDHRYISPWKLFNAREGGNNVYIRLMSALKNPDFWSN